ncbi:cysteine and histidine-rich domain-containing protein 1-like isoform X1 [Asterias amurensis]|uniref:cysteine and histidine-rich domain-containing protein 1-like isoform X1 n=1 Tax=Asterias amurensis TaxID=7602 RepID=UPI003AB793BC
MASGEVETHCYNKGCGKKFLPSENGPEACIHHPGEPVFHDAYKGWSCCKKRTTDFTEFLNMRGCTKGLHSNEKPAEKPKPQVSNKTNQDVVHVEPPKQRQPIEPPTKRPSESDPVVRLPVTVGSSLKSALENLTITPSQDQNDEQVSNEVTEGTQCKNRGCQKSYMGEQSDYEKCQFHPGQAVFHEGMKFWSCCERRTSDFTNFLEQEGCTTGAHLWLVKEDDTKKLVDCRYDWHQTTSHVVLSVYCKLSQPDVSFIETNRVLLNVDITFNQSKNKFKKTFLLEGVIDPTKSSMTMLGSKCEIKLKKGEACSWRKFELPLKTSKAESQENNVDH